MNNKSFLFLVLSFIAFNACDPQSCRDCESFNFDLSNWNQKDDTIATQLKFIDANEEIHVFNLMTTNKSEPHTQCEIVSTPDQVTCILMKSLDYSCASLNLDMNFNYMQFEVPNDNPALNDCLMTIELKRTDESDLIKTNILDIQNLQATKEAILESIPSISLSGQEYQNVWRWNFESMVEINTNNQIDSRHLQSVSFKEPIGIVELILENGDQLILLED